MEVVFNVILVCDILINIPVKADARRVSPCEWCERSLSDDLAQMRDVKS